MAAGLALPALLPLLFSFLTAWSQGLVPTGFIQYDMAYYVANAREHFDQGWQFTYGNPYAPAGTPAVYFQPHILLLGLLQAIGLPPAWAFNLFGFASLGFASWAGVRLYEELVGLESKAKKVGLVCFFWGGGILALLGWAFGAVFAFDPNDGWWMLNFGRNLVYPTEAYYHGVFLSAIWCLLRKGFGAALGWTALLSISHPFTGLSLALIVTAYAAMELALRSGAATVKLLAGAIAVTGFHVGYYLVFLNRSADHRALKEQWSLDWTYSAWTLGPALYLVGFVAFTRFTRWPSARAILTDPRSRLLLVWFAVILGLTQHDLLVKPMQPIHFARGYDWIALFFLAAPAMIPIFERLRGPALAAVVLLLLSDNLFWFASFRSPKVQHYAIALTSSEARALSWLRANARSTDVVVADDANINYLTSTYSAARSWYGHVHNTPHAAERLKQVTALEFPAPGPNLFLLRDASRAPAGATLVERVGDFSIYRRTL